MTSKINNISTENFNSEVIESEIPVLVQFSTPWCAPCRTFAPILESLSEYYSGKIKMCKIDAESNYEIAVKYGISSVPTVLVFRNGEISDKFIGLLSKEALSDRLNGMIKVA